MDGSTQQSRDREGAPLGCYEKGDATRVERSVFTVSLDCCLCHLATRPHGGRGGIRTHNCSLLVTSVRLRGVKKDRITRVERSAFVSFSELMSFH